MIKRFLLLIFIIGFCFSNSSAFMLIVSGPPGGTDYTQDANCMGAWYMNANTGDETDRSGEGGTLSEYGTTIPTSATVPSGYSGTSRDINELDGNEWLTHADNKSTDIFGADQPISICCWFDLDAETVDEAFVAKWSHSTNDRQYLLRFLDSSSVIQFYLSYDGESYGMAQGATDVSSGWHHVCGVYNDTDLRIYVDGSLDSNGEDNPKAYTSGIAEKSATFDVGSAYGGQRFDGLIDEVIIFDRELSDTEVSEIYTYGIDGTKGGND